VRTVGYIITLEQVIATVKAKDGIGRPVVGYEGIVEYLVPICPVAQIDTPPSPSFLHVAILDDVVVGVPDVIAEGLTMARAGGSYLEIGNITMGQVATLDPSQWVWSNKRIVSVNMYDPWIMPVALDFLRRTRDKYPVHKVVSHKFPLEQINEAFQEAEWANKRTAVTRACIVP